MMFIPFLACRRARRLMRRLAGSRDQFPGRGELEVHLSACENCAAIWRQLQAVTDMAVGIPLPDLNEDYWEQLAASIQDRIAARVRSAPISPYRLEIRRDGPADKGGTGWPPALRRPRWAVVLCVALLVAVTTVGIGRWGLFREVGQTRQEPPGVVPIPSSALSSPGGRGEPSEDLFLSRVWEFPVHLEQGRM
jgi:hypothetical protein